MHDVKCTAKSIRGDCPVGYEVGDHFFIKGTALVEAGSPKGIPLHALTAMILHLTAYCCRTDEGVSDEEAIARSAYDLRWKVALGLELDEKLCAKSTLQLVRAKLVMHERCGRLFETSVGVCREAGLLRRPKLTAAIDRRPSWVGER